MSDVVHGVAAIQRRRHRVAQQLFVPFSLAIAHHTALIPFNSTPQLTTLEVDVATRLTARADGDKVDPIAAYSVAPHDRFHLNVLQSRFSPPQECCHG